MEIKCACDNKGCSTVLEINQGLSYVDLMITNNKDGTPKHETIVLDPNTVVQLIKQLKQALSDMA